MIAARYARKSTNQEKATEEARSVTRQIDLARAFAEKQGWTVSKDLVFTDDGVSGGIFDPKKRPGLAALLTAARSTPRPFDILVIMNQSRLARRLRYAIDIVHDLTDAGVRIFSYQTGLERKMASAADRFMVGVDGFQDESYRESIQITTRETMRRKAERGEVAGGIVYGYTNVRRPGGGPVERVIDAGQAAVIRRIFELTARGTGLLRIAKTFNAEGLAPIRPGGRGWAPSAIREMLYRDLYRGRIVYGKTRWVDKEDTKKKVRVPESEWITLDAPQLRLVPPALWDAAHARIDRTRTAYLRHAGGRLWGRPESGLESPYLLTGLSMCGVCGGSLFVRKRPDGRHPRRAAYAYYACTYHHLRGDRVCQNALQMTMATADAAVLGVLREDILHPRVLMRAIDLAVERGTARPGDIAEQRASVDADLGRLEAEIAHLVDALASGAPVSSVQEALRTRERRRDDLRATRLHLDERAALPRLDPGALRTELRARLADWQGALNAEAVKARQIVRKLLTGRLTFHPDPAQRLYTFTGQASYGRLLAGTVVQNVWCPRGDSNTRPTV